MTFSTFALSPQLLSNISNLGYTTPTPIQTQALPVVLEGSDVIGLAQTGTGKTAAFALPLLQHLSSTMQRGVVRALVIAPTRELADQIYNSICSLGRGLGLRGVTLYGGVNIRPQERKLKDGVDFVVACPGRLLDHLQQRNIDLSQVQILVLDEADHMFDMGFLPTVRRILKFVPVRRQTLLFSATMPPEVQKLAEAVVRNPVTVKVGASGLADAVSHGMYAVVEKQKTALLAELLKKTGSGSTIVFTRTKHRARRVGLALQQAGYSAVSLQGNLSQNKRRDAMDGFREGRYQILVATDIAARGIDVSQVSHVFNYDMPDTVEAYTHRTGRTGRALRSGDAFSFTTREDTLPIQKVERTLRMQIERLDLPADLPVISEPEQADQRPRGNSQRAAASNGRRTSGRFNRRSNSGRRQGGGSSGRPNRSQSRSAANHS